MDVDVSNRYKTEMHRMLFLLHFAFYSHVQFETIKLT